jgi:hypothetical protein
MRGLWAVGVCGLLAATALAQPAAADPVSLALCLFNNVILSQQPNVAAGCVLANAPACGEFRVAGTLHQFPCPAPCAPSPPNGVVTAGLVGMPGDAVTANLQCDGATELAVTATALGGGGGFNFASGPVLLTGTMACVATGVTPTAANYFAMCLP